MSDVPPLPSEAYKVLADVLGGNGKVIAYRPYFAHIFGGACNALLLSQFWYWTNTQTVARRAGDGWFWKSQKEITQETGLTRTETLTARRKLADLGVVEEQVRGVPATVHFRVVKDVLFEVFWRYILANPDEFAENLQTVGMAPGQNAENLQTGLPNTRKLVRGKRASKPAEKLQAISESPSETTQKNTQNTSSESSASLFGKETEEKKTEPTKVPTPPPDTECSRLMSWPSLPEAEQQPWLDQARRELEVIHAGSGITPKPKLVEVRARNLYNKAEKVRK